MTALVVGGLMLGIGIAISGACPGTALAQAGAGYRDAWFTILGGIAGAMAYGYFEPEIRALLSTPGAGKPTFADLAGSPFWQIALPAAAVIVIALMLLERASSWREELGENADGYFVAPGEASGQLTGTERIAGRSHS